MTKVCISCGRPVDQAIIIKGKITLCKNCFFWRWSFGCGINTLEDVEPIKRKKEEVVILI